MKKLMLTLVLALCATSLFGESFLDLVRYGTPEQIKLAIDAGANVNEHSNDKYGSTPLMEAAGSNTDSLVISILLGSGAAIEDRDYGGRTPLMYAASFNKNPEIITILLKRGAIINARDKTGLTPLMYAAWANKKPEAVLTLLAAGAPIDDCDDLGKTALMCAVRSNDNYDIVMILLNAGANATLKSSEGKTALDYANLDSKLKATYVYNELYKATFPINYSSVSSKPPASWISTPVGSYKVERMWEESNSTYVLVSYRNTTNIKFASLVTVTALLYDKNDNMLDMNDRSFFTIEKGPIVPGFEGTVKIFFSFTGASRVEIRLEGH